MTANKLHVSYSDRHRAFVVTDNHGVQLFTNDGRPLVFATCHEADEHTR